VQGLREAGKRVIDGEPGRAIGRIGKDEAAVRLERSLGELLIGGPKAALDRAAVALGDATQEPSEGAGITLARAMQPGMATARGKAGGVWPGSRGRKRQSAPGVETALLRHNAAPKRFLIEK
jgi:hypothetical protein